MSLAALFTLAVLLAAFCALAFTAIAVDAVLVGALIALLLSGVIDAESAFTGFANPGVITVAALYVVVAGLRDTGATQMLAARVLGKPRSTAHAQTQLIVPTAILSAFLNNTPVVAALIPAVSDWCRKHRLSVSKLMMPLSFATILGGTCTLIGTSTNLLVNSLLVQQGLDEGLGMFELAWVGVPITLLGTIFMILAGRWLLPDRMPALERMDNPREYSVEMMVAAGGPLEGQTIEDAGLRQLPGMYLAEIERDGHILPAVSPREPLQGEDRLVFVGIVDSVVHLHKTRGLVPATEQIFKLDTPRRARVLIEAVVSHSCPLVGKTIREGGFRGQYQAVVLAVARDGARIHRKIGDIVLQPGDTLLLEARPSFAAQQRHSRDFFLVSTVEDSNPPQHQRAYTAIGLIALLVISVAIGAIDILNAALASAALMVITGCCSLSSVRKTIDWSLLVAIGAAIGIGSAVEQTGLAETLAHGFIGLAGDSTYAALTGLFVSTVLISSIVTNNAAAVIMLPIAVNLALGASNAPMAYAVVVAIGASASFLTPIGYQTNLMVYGPGGYRFTDFLRLGAPLTLLVGAVTIALAPWVWPLAG